MKLTEKTNSQQLIMNQTELTDMLGAGQPELYQVLAEEAGFFWKDAGFPRRAIESARSQIIALDKVINGTQPSEGLNLSTYLQKWMYTERILLVLAFAKQEGRKVFDPFKDAESFYAETKEQAVNAFLDALGEQGEQRLNEAFPEGQEREVIAENILRILMTLEENAAKGFFDEVKAALEPDPLAHMGIGSGSRKKTLTLVENKLPEILPVFGVFRENSELREGIQQGKETSFALTGLQEAVHNARLLQMIAEQRERKAEEARAKEERNSQRIDPSQKPVPVIKPKSEPERALGKNMPLTPLRAIYTPVAERTKNLSTEEQELREQLENGGLEQAKEALDQLDPINAVFDQMLEEIDSLSILAKKPTEPKTKQSGQATQNGNETIREKTDFSDLEAMIESLAASSFFPKNVGSLPVRKGSRPTILENSKTLPLHTNVPPEEAEALKMTGQPQPAETEAETLSMEGQRDATAPERQKNWLERHLSRRNSDGVQQESGSSKREKFFKLFRHSSPAILEGGEGAQQEEDRPGKRDRLRQWAHRKHNHPLEAVEAQAGQVEQAEQAESGRKERLRNWVQAHTPGRGGR